MYKIVIIFLLFLSISCSGQKSSILNQEKKLQKILADPSQEEIEELLFNLRKKNYPAKNVIVHDTIILSNSNVLYILSSIIEDNRHFGAVIIPHKAKNKKLPVVILATGGDGMSTQFDITSDFNHKAAKFPNLLGTDLNNQFIIVIPSFRGQNMIIGDKQFQSEGSVNDAFDGAAKDTIGFLNAALDTFDIMDEHNISICGGSRGGTVALLASIRDERISKVSITAAPTDMKSLYLLYPNQFKLLFFNDFLSGKISKENARIKFISSSPIYFTEYLPHIQIHHDESDPFVPVKFAKQLENDMIKNRKEVKAFYYNEGIHGFWDDSKYWTRVQKFLSNK
ncbi:alpha/beta hydrolase family protein [Aquimarina aggregata]|uniref:alpha/beta hydrolase family protein n=1 Tax=Aquimarina aggregata TaxID=1642818 RepID=UPI0024922B72|nr:prolyl oligopeptidase family serine peptidase [Aquimarina aggregata]